MLLRNQPFKFERAKASTDATLHIAMVVLAVILVALVCAVSAQTTSKIVLTNDDGSGHKSHNVHRE
jgi:hypothetical protein